MNLAGLDPTRYHETKYQQLLREAQQHRLVQEALKARPPKTRISYNFLAVLGSKLAHLGAFMEKRYGAPPPAMTPLKQQSNSECS